MFHISRWKCSTIASSVALSALALWVGLATPSLAAGKTITAVMHSDLRIIDPGFTTAYITRDHGYMVYDTLLATDSSFKIQPQMADFKISDDKLFYCRQRGLSAEEAIALIVNGFVRDVLQHLPMEFMAETQKLIGISLEGSVG